MLETSPAVLLLDRANVSAPFDIGSLDSNEGLTEVTFPRNIFYWCINYGTSTNRSGCFHCFSDKKNQQQMFSDALENKV